jgi:methionyl-tRNA synthetase
MEAFQKVELRVATVLQAEAIPRSKNLLKLTVDMGHERTIVAGIAKRYSPEELVGKQIVVVANLKPVKLMGVVSQGMALAATGDDGTLSLATLDRAMEPGTILK